MTCSLPSYSNFFSKNQDLHSHNTRNASKFRNPITKTLVATKFVTNTGVKLWNNLDPTITSTPKIGSFKRLLKIHIINKLP